MRIFILLLVALSTALSDEMPTPTGPDAQKWANKLEMNGYTLRDYEGFYDKWKLVTVRYRKDTGEQRFIYGNPLAIETLTSGKKDYPDGSVFIKIAFTTEDDKLFTSSVTPAAARRYQVMVRDQKKHKDTDGWGYAVFDLGGKTFAGDPKQTAMACAACHKLAAERGYVFAQFFDPKPFAPSLQLSADHREAKLKSPNQNFTAKLIFITIPIADLPKDLAARLPKDTKSVRSLTGPMRKFIFSGTLSEISPALTDETLREKMPAVLVGESGDIYVASFANPTAGACKKAGVAGQDITVVYASTLNPHQPKHEGQNSFCQKGK